MRTLRRCPCAVLAVVAAVMAGCGQKSLPRSKTYPVTGKVTYKGEPARYVIVLFEPIPRKGGANARARTDAEGRFELRTFSKTKENDGGVPGQYNVVIETYDETQGGVIPQGAVFTRVVDGEARAPGTYTIKDEATKLTIDVP